MKRPLTILASVGLLAVTAAPAAAEWRWVDEDTRVYEEHETRIYENQPTQVYENQSTQIYENQPTQVYENQPTQVYQNQPTYYEERYEYQPAVTSREVFRDRDCEVTRTYMSDGTTHDERRCTGYRVVPPHRFIIDRIGRHFDRMRGYDY
ncbi:MAG TPA: hypothetical protein VEC57_06985 [Candidatus Limnocylindrales bacterium]|nr:hypothetical protein [Candidatus Limnocylindrales bacterium]